MANMITNITTRFNNITRYDHKVHIYLDLDNSIKKLINYLLTIREVGECFNGDCKYYKSVLYFSSVELVEYNLKYLTIKLFFSVKTGKLVEYSLHTLSGITVDSKVKMYEMYDHPTYKISSKFPLSIALDTMIHVIDISISESITLLSSLYEDKNNIMANNKSSIITCPKADQFVPIIPCEKPKYNKSIKLLYLMKIKLMKRYNNEKNK